MNEQPDVSLENELATKVIGIAMNVHSQLGPGLLESAYKKALAYKLQQEGLFIEIEKKIPLMIDGIKIDGGFNIDILVEKALVLELKSVESISEIHFAQTLNYLRLGKFKLGLLINFNVPKLKYGIKRIINTK
ncbi:GxxExxY protein [Algoriphagus pacificus]|uniref:GxxExxY protein n=1 Tax=Algoriphagus pacificus TaxID=2811234 RepID=A0ABS3CG74_9BACT|nr:GxxExxY protein [Algoriphagus pacificus]MBN7816098.1 GxxExxY protein [Algoriphagus pacificus]